MRSRKVGVKYYFKEEKKKVIEILRNVINIVLFKIKRKLNVKYSTKSTKVKR